MSNPSLLCVPYRFKTSKLYSQIPDSGLGDFVVSRSASNSATRVNASGLIETVLDNVPRLDYPLGGITAGCPALLVEPSAQNLALQSADFNTTWAALSSATVNTNTAISPDGTQNADTINLAAVADSRISQTITVANSTTYTISCFYKNIALTAGQTFNMRFNNFATAPNNLLATATIDLVAGTATFAVGGTAGTGFSGTATGRVENYGNGWYRVSLTFTVGTAGGNAGGFQPGHVGSATARSFYAWGAQLEVGSIATSYIPTAASSVTRGQETISKTGISSLIGQTEGAIYCEYIPVASGPSGTSFHTNIITSARNINTNTGFEIVHRQSDGQIRVKFWRGDGTFNPVVEMLGTVAFGNVVKLAFAYKSGEFALAINGSVVATSSATFTSTTTISVLEITNPTVYFGYPGTVRHRAIELYPTRLPNTGPNSLQSLTQ